MDKFYISVLIGALILLIVILIVVGVLMSKLRSADIYPPSYATCPDYWDVSANPDYCGVYVGTATGKNTGNIAFITNSTGTKINTENAENVGICTTKNKFGCLPSATNVTDTSDSGHYIPIGKGFNPATSQFEYLKLNNNSKLTSSSLYPGTTDRCAKKRWADAMEISWDGITNFNGC